VGVREGNGAAGIVDDEAAEHAVPVDVPAGPDFYHCADVERCHQALTRAGFDPASVQFETVGAP